MIVFNCTTNIVGGAVQNAVNFIRELHSDEEKVANYYFFLSYEVYNQVEGFIDKNKVSVFRTPARSFTARYKIKKKAQELKPQVIYTSAGPAYVNFESYHIMGCSNPYILGANKYAKALIGNPLKKFSRWLHTKYQKFYISKANAFICQTHASKNAMEKIGIPEGKIFVVYNSISKEFLDYYNESKNFIPNKHNSKVKVIIPSAYYKHKDLERIAKLSEVVNDRSSIRIDFFLTINPNDFERVSSVPVNRNYIHNLGPYKHSDALKLFLSYDIVLQPSVLEVFSTTYIEAMAARMPLLVPKLDFTQDICGDAAYYYDVNSEQDFVEKIIHIASNSHDSKKYESGRCKKLSIYGSQKDRFSKITSIIEGVPDDV
ncbi:glycosyltransferase [Vibrio alginolyticus]|uniref:glycosyltransferase n=1 Tax=Vibrio alginolyticus TaxID=663 RepID=UPI00301CC07F